MNRTTITTLLGAAVASGLAGSAAATENPFAFNELSQGYVTVAEMGKDGKEMTCGEGKCGGAKTNQGGMNCGGAMMQKMAPAGGQKAMEGKCAGMNMGGGQAPAAPAVPAAPAGDAK